MKPTIGIIGGSGLYSMPGFEAQEDRAIDVVLGRSFGSLRGRQAGGKGGRISRAPWTRGHRLSPSELNFRANIYGFKALGVERILSLSAVGSLKEEHKPLDFVIPDQFVDRTRGRVSTFFGEGDSSCTSDSSASHLPATFKHCSSGGEGIRSGAKLGGTYLVHWRGRRFLRSPNRSSIAVGAWM